MKYSIYIFILLLLLTGCGKEETINRVEYSYNRTFYKVYEPYISNIDNNYVVGKIFNRYDLKEVEMGLMRISTKYFLPIKYYYQTGQYLKKLALNDLLSNEKLNKVDKNLDYKPKYISYIHEQDYLNLKGELKGISLGLVLNPYQVYTVSGQTRYDNVNIEELVNFGKTKAQDLLTYIRKQPGLSNVEIVIGLYIEENTTSMIPGSYVYETLVRGNNINKFNKLDEKYILLTDNNLPSIDLKTYENFAKLKQKIQSSISTLSIMGRGLYINKQLKELTIDVNINYSSVGEVNGVAQIIAQEIPNSFNKDALVEVIIKSENKVEAIISKDNNESKCKIFFIN